MKNLFFMDIDTQHDFMHPKGALYVAGAERMIPKLRRLFDFARKNDVTVISSMDAHDKEDPEFESFPPHCVRGSKGQHKIDETLFPRPLIFENKPVDRNLLDAVRKHRQIIIEKQAFDVFSNPIAERLLRVLPPRAIVFGVATEYCVKSACLGLRKRGVQTVVINDAIRAISPETEKTAMAEMKQAGVEFISLEMLLEISAG
jgi:nicotinamidase/pyrazinamidase